MLVREAPFGLCFGLVAAKPKIKPSRRVFQEPALMAAAVGVPQLLEPEGHKGHSRGSQGVNTGVSGILASSETNSQGYFK